MADGVEGAKRGAPFENFADVLIARVRALGHPLCAGLDPHLDLIPPVFRRGSMSPRDPATVASVEAFLSVVVDRLAGRVAVVKPQIAFFRPRPPISKPRREPSWPAKASNENEAST